MDWNLNEDETINGDLYIKGSTLNLSGKSLTVKGKVVQSNGLVHINGGKLFITGDYRMQTENVNGTYGDSFGQLRMTNTADYVQVGGGFVTQTSASHNGLLTAGVLEVRGNFTQLLNGWWYASPNNYLATGTHKTILSGTNLQTISFTNPGPSKFNILGITKPLATGYRFLCPTPVWNSLVIIGDIQPPTAPTNLSVAAKSLTTVSLIWSASSDDVGVTGYEIYRNDIEVDTCSNTSYLDTGLNPDSTYSYFVKAYDSADNKSSPSNTVSATTDPDTQAPTAPTNLRLISRTNDAVTLAWTAATDNVKVTGYEIYRDDTEVGTSTDTRYADSGLAPGKYLYTVKALDISNNRSDASNAVLYDNEPPSVPVDLAVSNRTATSITLTWSAAVDNVGVTKYEIRRNGDKVGEANGTSYSDTGLAPETVYSYTVIAYDAAANASDSSDSFDAVTTPDTQAPSPPENLTVSARTDSSVTLTWSAATDNVKVTGYRIFRDGAMLDTTDGTTFTDLELPPGMYNYTVRAFDAAENTSDDSNAILFDNLPPVAAIDTSTPFVVFNDGASLTFDGSPSSDAGGIKTYEWTFSDDGSRRSGRQVSRSFATPGIYKVTLVVTDTQGNPSIPAEAEITVKEKGNTVIEIAGVTDSGRYNQDVAVYITVTGGELTTILLDGQPIPDGFVIQTEAPFPHVLTAEAINAYGYTSRKTVQFYLDKTKPVAGYNGINTAFYNEQTTFDASSSQDANGIAEYLWTFSDEAEPRSGKIVTRSFTEVGAYTGTLAVKDSFGNWSENKSFSVNVIYRPVELAFVGVQNGGYYNQDVVLNVTARYGSVTRVTDQAGTVYENGDLLCGNRLYRLTATGVNFGGAEGTSVCEFTVDKEPPVAGIKSDGPIRGYNDGKPVILDGSPSTDNIGLATYEWVISDTPAQKYYGTVIQHAFSAPGAYTATLTVVDRCGNASQPVSIPIEIRDKGNTEIIVSGVTENGKYNADVNVSVSVNNGVLTEILLDGQAITATAFTVAGETPNPHVLQIKATNENEYVSSKTVQFWVDKTAPVAVPGVDVTAYKGDPVSFDAAGSHDLNGVTAYRWLFPGESEYRTQRALSYTFTAVGTYAVNLEVMDACGNWSAPASRKVTVKYKPAEVTIGGVVNYGKYNRDVTVNVTVKYGTLLSMTLNGVPLANNATVTENGKHTLTVTAENEGHEAAPTVTYTFTIDKIRPTAVIKKDNLSGYNDGRPVVLDGTLSTDNSGFLTYEWVFAGETTKYHGALLSKNFNSPGAYPVSLVVTDSFGNVSDPDQATVTISDKGSLSIDISGVAENGKYNTNVQAVIAVTGGTIDKILVDKQIGSLNPVFITEQNHEIYVEATSDTGYHTSRTLKFSIDKTPPVANAGGARSAVEGQAFTLTGGGTDRNPIVAYRWVLSDGRELAGNSVPCVFAEPGVYTAALTVADDHGNWSLPSITTITVSYRAPIIKLAGIEDGQKTNQDVAVNVEVTYGALAGMLLNGQAYQPGTPITDEGYYYLDITVADRGGEARTFRIHFAIDRTPPVAEAGPDVSGWNDGVPLTFNGYGSSDDLGVASLVWTFSDTAETYKAALVQRVFSTPGVYTATLVVKDLAGNVSAPDTTTITIRDKGNTAINFTGFSTGQKSTTDITAGVSIAEGALLKFVVDGAPVSGASALVTSDGKHTVYAEATNDQGYLLKKSSYFYIDKSLPIPDAGGDRSCYNGQTITFEGGFSWDTVGIAEYRWSFSDAETTYNTVNVTRTFATPGEYLAQLWVRDNFGNWCAGPDTAKVTVKDKGLLSVLTIDVHNSYGQILPGTIIVVEDGTGKQARYVCDAEGRVIVTVEEGLYKLYAYHSGYKSTLQEIGVRVSEARQVSVVLTPGIDIEIKSEARQLDLQEIQALGIDTSAPENRWVFKFEAVVSYEGAPQKVNLYVNQVGEAFTDDNVRFSLPPQEGRDIGDFDFQTAQATVIVQGTTSVLKDFYDLTVFVLNYANPSVTLDDIKLHLNLPQGLSLASIPQQYQTSQGDTIRQQTLDVDAGTVAGQSTKKIIWTLRGDQPGSYRPSVDYTGMFNPFQAKLAGSTTPPQPIVISDPASLLVRVEAPGWVVMGEKTAVTVSLTNTGAKPFYDAYLKIDDVILDNFQPAYDLSALYVAKEALNPGETLSLDVEVIPLISGPCMSKTIKQIGGNVAFSAQVLPSAPLDIIAESGDGVVSLRWIAAGDAMCHKVKRRCEGETAYTVLDAYVYDEYYDDTTVENFKKYYYLVVPVDNYGDGIEGTPSKEVMGFPGTITAAPASGTYDDPIDVALAITGDGAIHYTTDGSTPSVENSLTYAGPIRVNRSMIIRAIVTREGTVSKVFSHAYGIRNPVYGDFVETKWTWQAPDGPSHVNRGGEVDLHLPATQVYDFTGTGAAMFLRSIPYANWSAETRVSLRGYTAGSGFAAGMVVVDQDTKYTWGFAQGTNLALGTASNPALFTRAAGAESVCLRIRREGMRYCFEYRLNETDPWIYVTSVQTGETPLQTGLYAATWDAPSEVDLTACGFKVLPLPALDPAWHFESLTPGPNYHALGSNSFTLMLPDDRLYTGAEAPALTRMDLGNGDWTIKAQAALTSYDPYQFRAGLTVNFTTADRYFFGFEGTSLIVAKDGRGAFRRSVAEAGPNAYLRIRKTGEKYWFEYRAPGYDWRPAGEDVCYLPVTRAGVTAETWGVPAQVVCTINSYTILREEVGLDKAWTWEAPAGPICSAASANAAVISVPDDRVYDDLGTMAPKLSRTDLGAGDWTIATAASLSEYEPNGGFSSGLMLRLAGGTTFHWGFQGGTGLGLTQGEQSLALVENTAATIYLAISRTADRIDFLYRDNPDEPWRTGHSLALPDNPQKVGTITRTWQPVKVTTAFSALAFIRSLGGEWQWRIPESGPSHVVNADGSATLCLPADKAYDHTTSLDQAPMCYRTDLGDQDWTFEGRVSLDQTGGTTFLTGLAVVFSEDDLFHLGLSGDGNVGVIHSAGFGQNEAFAGDTVYLQVSKTGTTYNFAYRPTPQHQWTTVYNRVIDKPPVSVGFMSKTGEACYLRSTFSELKLVKRLPLHRLTLRIRNALSNCRVSGATLVVDGDRAIDVDEAAPFAVAENVLVLDLERGTHDLRLTAPGYEEYQTALDLMADQTLSIAMQPLPAGAGEIGIFGCRLEVSEASQALAVKFLITNTNADARLWVKVLLLSAGGKVLSAVGQAIYLSTNGVAAIGDGGELVFSGISGGVSVRIEVYGGDGDGGQAMLVEEYMI